MREYNQEQIQAIFMVRDFMRKNYQTELSSIKPEIQIYFRFREEVSEFQKRHLSVICNITCFTSKLSACCSREGIATFFADVVINYLMSSQNEIDALIDVLMNDKGGHRCVYLSPDGCLWRLKPIVCEFFLCKKAKEEIIEKDPLLKEKWSKFQKKEKEFIWPDKKVLFDEIEEIFIEKGYESPLMYMHRSPGLLIVKKKANINTL